MAFQKTLKVEKSIVTQKKYVALLS